MMSKRRNWLERKAKSIAAVLACMACIGFVHHWFSHNDLVAPASFAIPENTSDSLVGSPFRTVALLAQLDEAIASTRPVLSADIEALIAAGKFQRAKNMLLDRALNAVESADNNSLALHLGELGELALLQGDLGMAEVYLGEALELYDELQDELKVAGIHIQMGRLHLYARKRARKSSDSYDQLLVSRWKISQGRFSEAESQLKEVVESSLSLSRFGAAASALETLYRGYSKDYSIQQAQQVGIEAIKIHASSGNVHAANRMLDELKSNGLSLLDAERVGVELQQHHNDYLESVKAIGAARDYAQLYNQLSARGDALQAWRFRRQAELSLADASRRAQYRRQPDVLVELYRSNKSMGNAQVSLRKASEVFTRYGVGEGVEWSRRLLAEVY